MAKLIVCLDGTDQVKIQAYPTNISRLYDSIGGASWDAGNGSFETSTDNGPIYLGKYLPGVGTQGDPVLKVLGNAFGDGIAEPIVRGYTYLSRNYSPGDEIFIAGFSRGATAARALAGFVVVRGLLDTSRYDVDDKTAAYLRAVGAWYSYREPKPDFADQARLELIGGTVGQTVPTLAAADFKAPCDVKAVAVFDTVSSLGIPLLTLGGGTAFDFSICDTVLNDKVEHGFHALSADESRDLFSPTFWATRDNVVQQVFPGCHSDVGGGFAHRGLSDGALDWLIGQLQGIGVVLNRSRLVPPLAPDQLDDAQDDGAIFPFKFTPRSARAFPDNVVPSLSLKGRAGKLVEMSPCLAPVPYRPFGAYADGRPLLP